MGEITLTCNVEGGDPANEYSYHWTFEDSGSGTTFLENNTNIQNVYKVCDIFDSYNKIVGSSLRIITDDKVYNAKIVNNIC